MDAGVAAVRDHLDEVWSALLADVREIDDTLLQWCPGPEFNSIAILLRHLAGSERFWIGEAIGGIPSHRVRETEFVHDEPARADVLRAVAEARALTRRVLSGVGAADLAAPVPAVNREGRRLRRLVSPERPDKYWALLHYLEHLGYHRGQILLLRNLGRMALAPIPDGAVRAYGVSQDVPAPRTTGADGARR